MSVKLGKYRFLINLEKMKCKIWNHFITKWAEQYGEEYGGPFMRLHAIRIKLWQDHDLWEQLGHSFYEYTPEDVEKLWPEMYAAALSAFWKKFDDVSFSCNIISRRAEYV